MKDTQKEENIRIRAVIENFVRLRGRISTVDVIQLVAEAMPGCDRHRIAGNISACCRLYGMNIAAGILSL